MESRNKDFCRKSFNHLCLWALEILLPQQSSKVLNWHWCLFAMDVWDLGASLQGTVMPVVGSTFLWSMAKWTDQCCFPNHDLGARFLVWILKLFTEKIKVFIVTHSSCGSVLFQHETWWRYCSKKDQIEWWDGISGLDGCLASVSVSTVHLYSCSIQRELFSYWEKTIMEGASDHLQHDWYSRGIPLWYLNSFVKILTVMASAVPLHVLSITIEGYDATGFSPQSFKTSVVILAALEALLVCNCSQAFSTSYCAE